MSDSVGKSSTYLCLRNLVFCHRHVANLTTLDRVFVHALNTVKRIPRTGSARPPPAARLKLYGLYKQSMEGDVEGVMKRPDGKGLELDAEREKW